jgi:hypothetical protein
MASLRANRHARQVRHISARDNRRRCRRDTRLLLYRVGLLLWAMRRDREEGAR